MLKVVITLPQKLWSQKTRYDLSANNGGLSKDRKSRGCRFHQHFFGSFIAQHFHNFLLCTGLGKIAANIGDVYKTY